MRFATTWCVRSANGRSFSSGPWRHSMRSARTRAPVRYGLALSLWGRTPRESSVSEYVAYYGAHGHCQALVTRVVRYEYKVEPNGDLKGRLTQPIINRRSAGRATRSWRWVDGLRLGSGMFSEYDAIVGQRPQWRCRLISKWRAQASSNT